MIESLWHKTLFGIFSIFGTAFAVVGSLPGVVSAQFSESESAFPYEIQGQEYVEGSETTDIASGLIAPEIKENTSLIKRLTDYFRLSDTQYYQENTETPATNYVKRILNILLGLVSFLSLVMIIFAFYLIFFSKGEEAVGKAKKILIGVGIALAIMGLSRFIASFFFDIYGTVTGTGI